MTTKIATLAALLAAAIGLGATSAQAQQAQQPEDGPLLIAATVDCRYQLRPVEVEICSAPVLAAMDIQMATLFNILNQLVKPEVGVQMASDQQEFLQAREACSGDGQCIGQAYAERIGELDAILKGLIARGPY